MITEVGKFLRKLRIDYSEILLNMAIKLEMSAAYLSSIENGKRTIPVNFFDKVNSVYNLSNLQQEELKNAIEQSAKNVVIDFAAVNGDPDYIQTALLFARDFSHLNKIQLLDMKNILSSVNDGYTSGGEEYANTTESLGFAKSQ